MSCAQVGIIALYALAGLLPLLGFGHSFISYHLWKRYMRNRKQHISDISVEFNKRWNQSKSQEEKDAAKQWKNAEDAKLDPRGKPYGDIPRGLIVGGHEISSWERRDEHYKVLMKDIKYVGAGVVCGSVASIWSVLAL